MKYDATIKEWRVCTHLVVHELQGEGGLAHPSAAHHDDLVQGLGGVLCLRHLPAVSTENAGPRQLAQAERTTDILQEIRHDFTNKSISKTSENFSSERVRILRRGTMILKVAPF